MECSCCTAWRYTWGRDVLGL